jgi:hypothetical protein
MISGLVQKIAVLDERLAVGWTGTKVFAKVVIDEIISAMNSPDFDISGLMEVLEKSEYGDKVSLTGFMKSGDKVVRFGWGTETVATELYGEMELGGSGRKDFYDAAISLHPEEITGEANQLERAVAQTLSLTSSIMGKEMVTAGTLRNFYGGGFELASSIGGKIEKIGDITYTFFHCVDSKKKKLKLIPVVIKFGYINDVLIIRRSEFKIPPDSTGNIRTTQNDFYVLRPVYRRLTEEEIEHIKTQLRLPLESRFMCSYIFCPEMPPSERVTTYFQHVRTGEPLVRFAEDDKCIRVLVAKEFLSRVFS